MRVIIIDLLTSISYFVMAIHHKCTIIDAIIIIYPFLVILRRTRRAIKTSVCILHINKLGVAAFLIHCQMKETVVRTRISWRLPIVYGRLDLLSVREAAEIRSV